MFTLKKSLRNKSCKALQIFCSAIVSHLVSSCYVVGDFLAFQSRWSLTNASLSSLSQCGPSEMQYLLNRYTDVKSVSSQGLVRTWELIKVSVPHFIFFCWKSFRHQHSIILATWPQESLKNSRINTSFLTENCWFIFIEVSSLLKIMPFLSSLLQKNTKLWVPSTLDLGILTHNSPNPLSLCW